MDRSVRCWTCGKLVPEAGARCYCSLECVKIEAVSNTALKPPDEWIPIGLRQPDEYSDVLVYGIARWTTDRFGRTVEEKRVFVGYYYGSGWVIQLDDGYHGDRFTVTHWRPVESPE